MLEEKDNNKRRFKRLVFEDSKLVGAMCLNVGIEPGVIGYLIENKVDIGKHKQLLLERPRETSLWLMLETEKRAAKLIEV